MSSNLYSLEGKKILVTGASSGIGRAVAILAAEQGAQVIITARSEANLNGTKQLMKGNDHKLFPADLKLEEDIKKLAETIDHLDGIVHSAGVLHTLPYKFISRKVLEDIMSVNFYAPTLLNQILLKQKKINNGGSIVYISSISGNVTASKGNSVYSATKGAINASAKVLALEVAAQKIRVNNVAPGMVRTETLEEALSSVSKEQLEADEKTYPLGYGKPEDIAGPVIFLLSDASKWITGTTMVLDGGCTI